MCVYRFYLKWPVVQKLQYVAYYKYLMELYQFFKNCSQYGEYSVKYKEKLFLTAQCGICGTVKYKEQLFLTAQCSICGTVTYLTIDYVCAVKEVQNEI